MAHADLFVLPSNYEHTASWCRNHWPRERPCSPATRWGAAYDLVIAGKNGDMFRRGDAADLRVRMLSMLQGTATMEVMSHAARETFDAWFAKYSPIKTVDAAARRLLAARRASAG